MKITEIILEAFDQPYPMSWEHHDGDSHDAIVRLPDGTHLTVNISREQDWHGNDEWQVEFWRNNSQDLSGEGDSQRIMATVLEAIKQVVIIEDPERIVFSASKETDSGAKNASRTSLYTRLLKRYASSWGYTVDTVDKAGSTGYILSKKSGKTTKKLDPDRPDS